MKESEYSSTSVLLVGHGTVTNLEDLPEFLLRIRRGRPVSDELLAEVRSRYEKVGGSPLLRISAEQAAALERMLHLPVIVANRLWHPFIEEALEEILAHPVTRICVLPTAPYSVHVYADATATALDAVCKRLGKSRPELVSVAPWGVEPSLVRAHADHIRGSLDPAVDTELVLTAHSLPIQVIRAGDPYQTQFEASARAVLDAVGRPGVVAYQSQGADGGAWVGPDLRSVFVELKGRQKRHVTVAPIGFLADHVETLYDLDIEARNWARELDLGFVRVPALNTDAGLIEAMAAVVRRALS